MQQVTRNPFFDFFQLFFWGKSRHWYLQYGQTWLFCESPAYHSWAQPCCWGWYDVLCKMAAVDSAKAYQQYDCTNWKRWKIICLKEVFNQFHQLKIFFCYLFFFLRMTITKRRRLTLRLWALSPRDLLNVGVLEIEFLGTSFSIAWATAASPSYSTFFFIRNDSAWIFFFFFMFTDWR